MSAQDNLNEHQFVKPLTRSRLGIQANPQSAGQLYHGTAKPLSDEVSSGGMNFFTPHYYQAASFARRSAQGRGGTPTVYPVTPTGAYGKDPNSIEGYRSKDPLKITGPGMAAPDTQGMRELAKTYRSPPFEPGEGYTPPDKDPTYRRDDWSSNWDH